MIAYFDTSAFVPLLIQEPASSFCERLWTEADAVVTSRLLYVESAAALAQGRRSRRLTAGQHNQALAALDRLWPDFDVVEADAELVARAAEMTALATLRGYDAVHCASAEQVNEGDLVLASGDRQLLTAAGTFGLAVADVNRP